MQKYARLLTVTPKAEGITNLWLTIVYDAVIVNATADL